MRGNRATDTPHELTAEVVAKASTILRAAGLSEVTQWVLPLVRPSIELVPGKRVIRPLQAGSSKIGGCPDLPASVKWPVNREKQALSFLLQVALGDCPALDILPPGGLLSFYYDTLNMPDAAEALASRSCRVLYFASENDDPLSAREGPTDEDGPTTDTFEEFPLKPDLVPSFPDDLTLLADSAARAEYLCALVNPERSVFKLLGHPNTIQNPMQVQCAMIARGLDPEADDLPAWVRARLKREAERWLLLLQIDSAKELQLNWGDTGRLYFWIRQKDLEARRFEKIMLMFQSH